MASQLADAHIEGQRRLRVIVAAAVTQIWRSLPAYDRPNLDEWLSRVVPVVTAGQRQSVALTEAYIARSLERQPLGVNPERLIGAAVRNGTLPEAVYERSFVTVWTALKQGAEFDSALLQGLDRATSAAATDVQLSMSHTLREVGQADPGVLGYQRVPDAGACEFCRLVAGQRYTTSQLMPIHNHCGCGVDVITTENRSQFTGNPANDLSVPGAAVHNHGELGPVLTDPTHDFTSASDI